MSSPPPQVAVDIGTTYGATFIGLILSAVLYGVTMVQSFLYFCSDHCRQKDRMSMKGFIAALLILDTVHTAFCIRALYWYLIQHFGDINNLNVDMWAMEGQIDLNSSLAFIIQLFYARRLHLLSKRTVCPAIIVVVATVSYASSYVYTFREHVLKLYSRESSLKWVTCVGMGTSTFVDILITVSMCWCLYQKRTGFTRTDSILVTLMIFSVNTGLLTSILASASLISYVVSPSPLLSKAIYLPLGKCYVNSLLAFLNNRGLIRKRQGLVSTTVEFEQGRTGLNRRSTVISVKAPHRVSTLVLAGDQHDPSTGLNTLGLKRLEATTPTSIAFEAAGVV
ncbi:hypothetical protein BJV74DRAFT_82633 [Russula compacta]|nr:hypothetical protein BJV74DRAFT_82633 [Russula compacta]